MRLDNARGAADVASGNGLGINEMKVYLSGVIEEPSAQEPGLVRRVILAESKFETIVMKVVQPFT